MEGPTPCPQAVCANPSATHRLARDPAHVGAARHGAPRASNSIQQQSKPLALEGQSCRLPAPAKTSNRIARLLTGSSPEFIIVAVPRTQIRARKVADERPIRKVGPGWCFPPSYSPTRIITSTGSKTSGTKPRAVCEATTASPGSTST
jgi:hypothetical protein